ncbi:sugar phosphate isomerase/epimerase [Chitinophaga lutea]|uniref:Sugar phosphate isomerase/epimerase n=1 Tax=Chitinophaga lutea TaxID=2488634 RepID=A0A3N4QK84_9BACT|nr:sugar phosphate isomerase/epimerase [Chitinophaga lutea]RPE12184.1 sugar phosphate isomerase/epimerase [Chitinophaga lutea]
MQQQISLGVSTWLWTSPFTTATIALFPKIKAMGYDVVEIPAEYPEQIDGAEVARALDANGLKAVVCGAFGPTRDLTHTDPAVNENCFTYIRDCFALCNAVGAGFLAGPMYSAVGKTRMLPPEERKREWDLAVKNLQRVCADAQAHGVSIALEPLNRFESDLVNTAADVHRLVTDINHAAAGILLDGFHMALEERSLSAAIELAGPKLLHVQVAENYRGVPGTGQTPWQDFKKGLDTIGYRGVVSIESFTPDIKELAGAVCIWRSFAETQDAFAEEGYRFLHQLLRYER